MEQLHRRLTDEQIRLIMRNYCEGKLTRQELQETLGIGKSRFFVLLKGYRKDPQGFSLGYHRSTPGRIQPEMEQAIQEELRRDVPRAGRKSGNADLQL